MASFCLSQSSAAAAAFRSSMGRKKSDAWDGLHSKKLSLGEGINSNIGMVCLKVRNVEKYRSMAALVPGEGEGGHDLSSNGKLDDMNQLSMEDDLGLGDDLDRPTQGFHSISDAIEDIRQGKIVIVVDDKDRENQGDLVMAAELMTPEAMEFIVKYGSGLVCVSMQEDDLQRLRLPLMVPTKDNQENLSTAFTVSVDAKHGTKHGASINDRVTTVKALASRDSKHDDFNRPGHIFPLKYRKGGVLKRAGHTEASVDLAVLAGLDPIAVLCEITDHDGSMARSTKLREFAEKHNLKIICIADLIRFRRKRVELIESSSAARLPTTWGTFKAYCYKSHFDGIEHVAMVKGDIGDGHDVLVRVHSECLTGDIFGSERCDCGNQLALAMKKIEEAGRGVVVYLRGHEGRGIGLGHKLKAYNLQDAGRDTVEANLDLGLPVDSREYGIGAQILRDLGVRSLKLMTNNPTKYIALKGYGLTVSGRVPLITPITKDNKKYLETKRKKMGHVYTLDLHENGNGNGNGSSHQTEFAEPTNSNTSADDVIVNVKM